MGRMAAAAAGALALGQTIRGVQEMESRMAALRKDSGLTESAIEDLRSEVYRVSTLSGINVDVGQALSSIESIVEKTGDIEFARRHLQTLVETIGATGGEGGAEVGRMVTEFRKLKIEGDGVGRTLAILNTQAKAGSFLMRDFAPLGERVFSAWASLGYEGEDSAREMGALLQTGRLGVGSSEMAATAFEATVRTVTDAKKLEAIRAELGVDVRNEDGSYRRLSEVLTDVIDATQGDITRISTIFDAEAMRFVQAIAQNRDVLAGHLKREADARSIANDAAIMANTQLAKQRAMRQRLDNKAQQYLTGALGDVVGALQAFEGEIMTVGAALAVVYGTVRAGQALRRGVLAVRETRAARRGGTSPAATGRRGSVAGMPSTMRVQTIYAGRIVGGPGGRRAPGRRGAGGAGAALATAGAGAAMGLAGGTPTPARAPVPGVVATPHAGAGPLAKIQRTLAPVGNVLRAGATRLPVVGGLIGGGMLAASAASGASGRELAADAGGIGGGLAGAAAGAALGSVVPLVGTAIGGIVGGLVGGFGGEWLARKATDWALGDDDDTALAVRETAGRELPPQGDGAAVARDRDAMPPAGTDHERRELQAIAPLPSATRPVQYGPVTINVNLPSGASREAGAQARDVAVEVRHELDRWMRDQAARARRSETDYD